MSKRFCIVIIICGLIMSISIIASFIESLASQPGRSFNYKLKNIWYSDDWGCCYKCGAKWAWKNHISHPVSDSRGLFLFCEDCDKIVTVEERWEALDKWKSRQLEQIGKYYWMDKEDTEKHIKEVLDTEFIEWPR